MANAENNVSVEMIEVEVACAVEGTQEVIALRMPAGLKYRQLSHH